jgi:methionine sulfoxide reductase heme-binding subunit
MAPDGIFDVTKPLRFTALQALVHAAFWILVAWLTWSYLAGRLGVNPIQAITQRTGKLALIFLTLSLACTPLNTLFGLRQALTVRRALGLYAFLFAVLHFIIFSGLDYGFNGSFILQDTLQKPYVWVGAATLLILSAMALTSFRWWMKKLGKNWKLLHRLVYLAGLLVVLHYGWAKKGDLLRLRGDIWQPLAFGIVIVLLLLARLPGVRRSASKIRHSSGALYRRARNQSVH